MHNHKYQCHKAASCTYTYHLLATQQEPHKRRLTLNEQCLRNFVGKWQDRTSKRTRGKEREREKERENMGKRNQMTALRFQTGKKFQTSPASLRVRACVWSCLHVCIWDLHESCIYMPATTTKKAFNPSYPSSSWCQQNYKSFISHLGFNFILRPEQQFIFVIKTTTKTNLF